MKSSADDDGWTVFVVASVSLLVLGGAAASAIPGVPWFGGSDGVDTPAALSQPEAAFPVSGPATTEIVGPMDTVTRSAPENSSVTFPVTSPTSAVTTVVSTPPSPDVTTAASTAPDVTATAQGSIPSASVRPPGDDLGAPVESIVIVPAFRDIIMSIDGQPVASDSTGTIAVPPESGDRVIEFVGSRAEPPLRQFELVGWGDTSTAAMRRVAELPGPVVELGLQTRVRVVVDVGPGAASAEAVVFSAPELGEITVPVGEPTWVPETTVRLSDGRFEAVAVSYVAVAIIADGERTPAQTLRFDPTPEARWVATVR